MLRASAAAEQAGVPSASLVCEGSFGQSATTAAGLGMPNLPFALASGHVGNQSDATLRHNIREVTSAAVIANLTEQPAAIAMSSEPSPRDIVGKGTFDEINEIFYAQEWSDGLPIVPPTLSRVEAFLRFTDADQCLHVFA